MSNYLSEFTLQNTSQFNRHSVTGWIISHTTRHWFFMALALVGAVGNAVLAGVQPLFIGQAFNVIIGNTPDRTHLLQIALWLALTQAGRAFLQFFRNAGFEMMAQRVERDIRDELYVSLLGKSMTFHSLQPVGDTMARATNDVREVNFLFSPGLSLVIGSINFLIVPIFVAPSYHPSLVFTPLIFIFLYGISLHKYLKGLEPVTDEVRISFGALNTRLAEVLDGIETVKGAAQELLELGLFRKYVARYRAAMVRQGDREARYMPLLWMQVALAVGLFHALFLHWEGILDLGQVVGYFELLLMLDFPTFVSLWAYSQISLGLAGARRILELMNRENNLDQNISGYTGDMRGEIEFRDVCFSYKGSDECCLENITFKVKAGQKVAIVGQTGSGKTSLIKLINRTYDVTRGQVLVDGIDVRDWNLESLRRNIAIIEQDIFLFSRSIVDNIAFGQPDVQREKVEEVSRAAQVDEFVAALSGGYETVIGERGVMLSGGQRQRIALARALLTEPKILILDDSTSAIDSQTEDKIQRAIYAAARGRTTIMITHRLSQIRWADLIIVLRKGRVAALGTHEELMSTSEAYRRIFSE